MKQWKVLNLDLALPKSQSNETNVEAICLNREEIGFPAEKGEKKDDIS